MVPVSVRGEDETGELGNRITLAFVQLPLDESDARIRLGHVHAATTAFKQADRPAGTETVLGAELLEAHPVVPIAEGHALSIGIFTYQDRLHFGLYADPEAFPQVSMLPAALDSALGELAPESTQHPAASRRAAGGRSRSPALRPSRRSRFA
jgi:diacylglycerol O-acyltransferase / wax synthase